MPKEFHKITSLSAEPMTQQSRHSAKRDGGKGDIVYNIHCLYLLLIPLLLITANLSANCFLPSFGFVFPLAWLAFIPIVFIEAFVMRKFLKQESFIKLLFLNTLSNALSTFIGIPIAFALYAFLVLNLARLPLEKIIKILSSFGYEPSPKFWVALISIAVLALFPLFFFISVWIERGALRGTLRAKYDELTITKAVKSANLASYIFLFIAYIVVWVGFVYYPSVFSIFSFW